METTSATMPRTPARRTILLALALALTALLLAGLAAAPAGAEPRSPTVRHANNLIDFCFSAGGEPSVIMDSTGESITVVCTFPDGKVMYCDASKGGRDCTTVQTLSPASRRLAAGVDVGALPQAQSTSGGQTTPVATVVAIPPDTHLALSGGRLILVDDDQR